MKKITEDDKPQLDWFKRAADPSMTLETLSEFLRELTEDYEHDYGTICHAITAAALAAARAVDRSPTGGITGFQAGCVMWGFISEWQHLQGEPLRLVKFQNMLYPQYENDFGRTISKNTWDWLQKRALELLAENDRGNPEVRAHWQSIADGKVPFGYRVSNES
jgi:hypothetical protein